jgi:hypothetical protein
MMGILAECGCCECYVVVLIDGLGRSDRVCRVELKRKERWRVLSVDMGGCFLLFRLDNSRVDDRSLFTLLTLKRVNVVVTGILDHII